MIPTLSRWRLPCASATLLCSCFITAQALAQPNTTANRPDPLDPKAAVPALRYESAMAKYRGLSDEKPLSWREANDAVARIGGWRVYAREAQQPEPSASAPASAPAAPARVSPPVAVPAPPTAKPADTPQKPMPGAHSGHKKP